MNKVFRINNRYHVQGKGTIYVVLCDVDTILHVNGDLYDLAGNTFQISGIETSEPKSNNTGIMLKPVDGSEMVQGNLLLTERGNVNFLFCNHPLYSKCVDEDFELEYQIASKKHACALFSYEDLEGGHLSIRGDKIMGLTIYRGWMMRPEMYEQFFTLLKERGIILINTPEEYSKYHMLPYWYEDFKNETAESVWTQDTSLESVLPVLKKLKGSYIVKDYVKSRKHEWYDACFIRDISDETAALKTIENFIKRQGEDLIGGVVLRKFEALKQIGFHPQSGMPLSEEYRAFICGGKIIAINAYWTNNSCTELSNQDYKWIESIAARVKSNFVTIDFARKENGEMIIMEFGDGQVSGLQQLKPEKFYSFFEEE